MKKIIILGSGGHAEVLIALLQAQQQPIHGISSLDKQKTNLLGINILGDDSCLKNYDPTDIILVNGLGSVSAIQDRATVYQTYQQQGYQFLSLQHDKASLDSHVHMGKACQIMHGATLIHGVHLGENVLINSGSVIEHHCYIGDHSHIACGVTLCGQCHIEAKVHIGAGATVIQGIRIGTGAVIAAGAVVTNNVKPYQLVAGIPARFKKCLQ